LLRFPGGIVSKEDEVFLRESSLCQEGFFHKTYSKGTYFKGTKIF
jgi:hypothetical protein